MKAPAERFLDESVPAHCKPSTAYEYRQSIVLFIEPRIGHRGVTEFQRSDIAARRHDMRTTPYQTNCTLGVVSKVFNMAEVCWLRFDSSNPCLHVKRFKEEKRERFLNAEEFGCLGTVLDDNLEDGTETRSAVAAVQLLMLASRRLLEVRKLG